MPMVQMNVRIDEDVKVAGDAVLASIGYTPTRIVRAVWRYAAQHADSPDDIEKLLQSAERSLDPALEETRKKKVELAERGPGVFEGFLQDMGVGAFPTFASGDVSAPEQREYAAVERALRKDLING